MIEIEIFMSTLIVFFGACIGSFLNVCIYRIPLDESIVFPCSHCPNCNKAISWYDNIPLVSWFALQARCRHCKEPISPRYVLVELFVAVLFVCIWFKYDFNVLTPIYWIVMAGLVVATFIDFEHYIIPDRISLGGIALGLVLSFIFPVMHVHDAIIPTLTHWEGLLQSVIGVAAGAGTLWIVSVIGKMIFKKDAMGLGDVKLLGAIGAFLGWRAVIFTIIASSFIGSIVGIALIIMGNREWQSRLPYGPYLAFAAMAWVFWGVNAWNLYMNWMLPKGF